MLSVTRRAAVTFADPVGGYRTRVVWWSGSAFVTWIAAALAAMVLVSLPGSPAEDAPGGQVLLLRTGPAATDLPITRSGNVVRAGDRAASFPGAVGDVAATAGGVYVLVGDDLWVTDLDATLRTGISGAEDVVASPDGRYLGFVDHSTPAGGVAVTVYDTRTGERVVHSTDGSGYAEGYGLGDLGRTS